MEAKTISVNMKDVQEKLAVQTAKAARTPKPPIAPKASNQKPSQNQTMVEISRRFDRLEKKLTLHMIMSVIIILLLIVTVTLSR